MNESSSAVERAVQERIAAARRRAEEERRRRAEFAAARQAGVARRNARRLFNLAIHDNTSVAASGA